MATELAAKEALKNPKHDWLQLVPIQYWKFKKVFDQKASERLPGRRPWDHPIDLKPNFIPKSCKIYSLSETEQAELDTFLDD